MLTLEDTIIRLLIAAALGAVIGFEREKRSQPAGLRTHIILTIGAAVAMCISINISSEYKVGDPERIAAQVISGIGFLGAGAIFRFGSSVKGLTTAASLWTMAVIGLSVGAGYIGLAVATTFLVLVILISLNFVERHFIKANSTKTLSITAVDKAGFINEVGNRLKDAKFKIRVIHVEKYFEENLIKIEAITTLPERQNLDSLIKIISEMNGIKHFTIN